MRHKFIQENWTSVKVHWAMEGCGAPKRKHARHARLLARLLLVHLLCLLLAPGVMLWGLSGALLTHTSCASQTPIAGLRVFLRCRLGRLQFPGMMTLLVLASSVFGLGAWAPMGTFLRRMLTTRTFLWWFLGKRGQPGALGKVLLQLLTRRGYGVKACPTHETHVVMRADNVVEVCRIILDGIRAEWATWYPWPVPILGFIRQEDWNTHKHVACMQFLQ